MRLYEFSPIRYLQTLIASNAAKHQHIQQLLAAQIANNANQD